MKKRIIAILAVSLLSGTSQVFAEDIPPYQSTPVQPYQSTPVQPYQSTPVQPYQSTPVQPYQSTPVQPANSQLPGQMTTPPVDPNIQYAIKTFILWVPGTTYIIPNFDANTSTLYISAGTLPKSTINVRQDGTYTWNSAWDNKIIGGKWTQNKDGSLNILAGQEGKNWVLVKGGGKYEDVFLMDGFTWYSGKAVTLTQRPTP